MSELEFETKKDQDEGRQDCIEGYCPRKNDTVLIVSSRCFYQKRSQDCAGCVFDQDRIFPKLILIMCQILQERGN